MPKKIRNVCRDYSFNHESAFKTKLLSTSNHCHVVQPVPFKSPTICVTCRSESLWCLGVSPNFIHLSHLHSMTPGDYPSSLHSTEEVSRDGKKCCPKIYITLISIYLNLLPGGYESGDQTRFHSIFFLSVCASSTFLFWFAGAGGLG